jgi:hypothetical protein
MICSTDYCDEESMPNEGEIRRTALARERRQLLELIYRVKDLRRSGDDAGAASVQAEIIERYRTYNAASKRTRPVKLMSDWELLPSLKSRFAALAAEGRHHEAARVWRELKGIEKQLQLRARAARGEIVLLDGGER